MQASCHMSHVSCHECLYGHFLSTYCSSAFQNFSATNSFHPLTESMRSDALAFFRLIRSFYHARSIARYGTGDKGQGLEDVIFRMNE